MMMGITPLGQACCEAQRSASVKHSEWCSGHVSCHHDPSQGKEGTEAQLPMSLGPSAGKARGGRSPGAVGLGLTRGCSHQEDVITSHAFLQDLLTHHLQQAVGHQHLEVSAGLPRQQNLFGRASLGLCPVA